MQQMKCGLSASRIPTQLLFALLALWLMTVGTASASETGKLGTYSRQSKVCGGGPGFADSKARPDCFKVFEDSIWVGKSLNFQPGEGEVFVDMSFHFGTADHCSARGHGTLVADEVILLEDQYSAKGCRLKILLKNQSAKLIDPSGSCVKALCTAQTSLHGLTYKRAAKAKRP
ncbi:MAG: hypothetical protein JNM76_01425 [Betaproteobacteria bacterium]|nr:hypothetical protein [Betaproteobacteria bacterium]